MQPLPPDISLRDIDAWLGECWFLVRHEDRFRVATLDTTGRMRTIEGRAPEPPAAGTMLCPLLRDDGTYELSPPLAYRDIYPYWPFCGYTNLGNHLALYVERFSKRQWKRSFSLSCCKFVIPNQADLSRVCVDAQVRTNGEAQGRAILAAFNPVFSTGIEALNLVRTKSAYSRAITPYICIARSTTSEPQVWYRTRMVGMVTKADTFLPLDADPELSTKLAKRIGVPVNA